MILIALATVASAPLLPPAIARDLRCVAVLGVAADPTLAEDGAFYAAIVGADAMDATGQSREQVRDLILDQVRVVRAAKSSSVEVATCVSQMRARVAIERAAQ